MVINKTDMSIGCIPDAIDEAICFFLQIYPYQPVCSYEIILCDFFDCTAFGKTAELMEKYLHKGTKILLQGRIENNNYVKRDGQKVYGIRIVAENIEFAEGKSGKDTKTSDTVSAPASARKYSLDDSGFINIPEGIEEGLPFV